MAVVLSPGFSGPKEKENPGQNTGVFALRGTGRHRLNSLYISVDDSYQKGKKS